MANKRKGRTKFCLSLINEADKHIIDYLYSLRHKSEYIKDLIMEDLKNKGIITEQDVLKSEKSRTKKKSKQEGNDNAEE